MDRGWDVKRGLGDAGDWGNHLRGKLYQDSGSNIVSDRNSVSCHPGRKVGCVCAKKERMSDVRDLSGVGVMHCIFASSRWLIRWLRKNVGRGKKGKKTKFKMERGEGKEREEVRGKRGREGMREEKGKRPDSRIPCTTPATNAAQFRCPRSLGTLMNEFTTGSFSWIISVRGKIRQAHNAQNRCCLKNRPKCFLVSTPTFLLKFLCIKLYEICKCRGRGREGWGGERVTTFVLLVGWPL
jgi:hypothetical protein